MSFQKFERTPGDQFRGAIAMQEEGSVAVVLKADGKELAIMQVEDGERHVIIFDRDQALTIGQALVDAAKEMKE